MKTFNEIETEVMRVHNLFWESYARRDIDLRFSLCSDDITFIGSGLHERATNKEDYKRINNEGVKQFPGLFKIDFLWINFDLINEGVACVESEVIWSQPINNEMSKELYRNTTLLKYVSNEWRVVHVHGSVPDYRLKDGDYMTNEKTLIRNKELERQVFERTQDLKKTLEELEQKNRELEIETALEKVRSSALAMKQPADMIDVCRIISDQLQLLNVKDIRNIQTAIINEAKGIYLNYEYFTQYKTTSLLEIEIKLHPVVIEFANEIKKSNDAFFTKTFEGEALKDWREYRRKTNQNADPMLDKAKSLHYYFYSIGPGALGVSTYAPLNEEDIAVFKRFRNVFELAYRRFVDIEQAIAQAKEARIEAALEKVRAVAMSMNKPDDLLNICEVLYQEFRKLGFDEMRNAMINIHNDEKKTFLNYDYSDEIGKSITPLFYNIHPVIEKQIKQIRSANDAFSETVFKGKDLEGWKEFRRSRGEKDDQRIDNISALHYYFYSIGTGSIGISTFQPIGDEKLEILKRFRNVFSLSYQRYSDIALAEAQAREAQIEAALERVRAKAMAMHNSIDLSDTMAVLFTELPKLGINSLRCGVVLLSRDSQRGVFYAAATTPESDSFTMIGAGDMAEHSVFLNQYENWLKNENYFTTLSNEELQSYYKALFARLSIPYKPKMHEVQTEHGYYFAFSAGMFYAWAEDPYSDAQINILNRFKAIIDLTFRRYLDLQKAEAQAREAQIELALERVRARTMAMQKSGELAETAYVLFQQFGLLGASPEQLTIAIIDETHKELEFWLTLGGNQMNRMFKAPINEPIVLNRLYFAWQEQNKSLVIDISGDELKAYYNFYKSLPDYKVFNDFKDSQRPEHRRVIHSAFFSKGWLSVSTPEPRPAEAIQLLERFATVFDGTYTRFLDLQKAEAQAREAQIEAALERVRSRTMGMQKSEELKEVIRVVYEQFVHLKINVDHAGFVVDYTPRGDWHFWIADEQDIPSKITHPYFESVWANQFNEAKEKGADFFATNLNFEEKNKFYNELLSFVPGLPETSKDFYLRCPGLAASTVLLENVSLYIENFSGIPYTDEENNTLVRFGKVFRQTYTRFLDLQKAEAQAREAQIEASLERVRSKAMAMHSPNDLSETVNVFFKELKTLGIIPIRCGVGQIDAITRTTSLTTTTSSQQGESFRVIGKVKQTGHPVLDGIFDHWKLQKEYHPVLQGEDIKAYYNVMNTQIGYPEYPDEVTQYGNNFFFKEGFVFAWTEKLLSEEELIIFRRFTSVLSLTFRRYLDLKEAEEQAKEAKIEASLEKVRSKTMAMQSSEELADTAAVVFQQLINLGIEPNRIYITIIKDESGTCEFWITDEDGSKVSSGFKANLNENHSFKKMYAGWKENKKSITIDMQGEELGEYFRHLSNLNVPFKGGLTQNRRIQYIAYFSKGFIGVASPDETKPETIQLLERFAAVFNLTYTRFNDLKQAEAQNKIIQAENDRKTKELEEARQLQLSLLPKAVPQLPNLDIAVYMKTATEVGGDYYDFNIQENGVLNIGFGDATGHGLQAGTMITLMKGFFTSDVTRFSPQKFLEHCNGMIRNIKLGRILMSFSHLRFENNRLLISSAGMPPIYYHNKKNNRAEEIIIQGLPLGAMKSASYKLVEKELTTGDTILLLTDGLPEQMNKGKVVFDYSRILKFFGEIVENTPEKIISALVKRADEWMNETKQADDMTFVVIRVK